MSTQAAFATPRSSAGDRISAHQVRLVGLVVSVAALVCAAVLAIDVLGELRDMATTLNTVSVKMAHLESMDAKLTRTNAALNTTNLHLARMDRQAQLAGAQLASMNESIRGMRTSTALMGAEIRSMGGDIHTMSHKISESFLFRGVK